MNETKSNSHHQKTTPEKHVSPTKPRYLEGVRLCEKLHNEGKTINQIVSELGRPFWWVNQHLSLRRLNPAVEELLCIPAKKKPQGKPGKQNTYAISFEVAFFLSSLPKELQTSIANEIISRGLSGAAAKRLIRLTRHNENIGRNKDETPVKKVKSKKVGSAQKKKVVETVNQPEKKFGHLQTLLMGRWSTPEK